MVRRIIAVLALGLAGSAAGADVYRQTLTDVGRSVHVDRWQITSKVITPGSKPWSVRKVTLHGGKQEGVELIVVENGRLRFEVIPTRGMGIRSVTRGGVRFGWSSPIKDVVHPAFVNLNARGGLGWLDGFSEWLCRCGLENNGGPGEDRFINNQGAEATMQVTLHGKIANLPAQEVEVVVDRTPPYRIHVRGRVAERMFHGPKLELWTDISTEPGSEFLRVEDVITNRGGQPQEFQILYHTNYGEPLLGSGAVFSAPASRVFPLNDRAAEGIRSYATYRGPTPGYVEQVYCLHPLGGNNGRTMAVLRNRAGDMAGSMSYAVKELPYLTLWKNTVARADGYVTGIEPGTNFPNTRRVERERGRVPKLAPGASHRVSITFGFHLGKAEVDKLRAQLQGVQAGRPLQVDTQPEAP